MSIEAFISAYGYPAVLLGTFLEGETTLVMAGFLAHRGYLSLPVVLATAFVGTFIGDQLFFHIGRYKGTAILEKRPHWKVRTQRAFALLHQHQVKLILGFRFLYGLRSVTPFVIGASRISPWRYLCFSLIGGAFWTVTVGSAGYLLGNAIEVLLDEIKHYEKWILAGMAAVGLASWMVHRLIESRNTGIIDRQQEKR
ncbi:MAG: DedA family protein [Pseudomonadota bacterium]